MPPSEQKAPTSLRQSLLLVTVSGCLLMGFMAGTTCPLLTDYFLELGATERHFGLLTGLPMMAILFQFVGALITNRVRNRKTKFLCLHVVGRLLFLGVAFLPAIWIPEDSNLLILALVAFITAASIFSHIAMPLWFSWMADLIPRRILNRYWGVRQRAMSITWAMAFLAIAGLTYFVEWPTQASFRLMLVLAVAAGIMDAALFIWIREPEHEQVRGRSVWKILAEPFRQSMYRQFMAFWCLWSVAIFSSASFLQVYALKILKMTVWETTLAWCMVGLGVAISAPYWGRLADRHGNRPVLTAAIIGKPIGLLVFICLSPESAPLVLPVVFLFDGMLNGGTHIGGTGYMFKMAPRQNRAMFISTIIGLSGIAAGLATMAAGFSLERMDALSPVFLGRTWNNYQLLFAFSFVLRCLCVPLAFHIREPKTSSTWHVLMDVAAASPIRFLRYPIGLNRPPSDNTP